ncbi:endonuclease domain-containing protein [candidate division KSB1 bacterium]|nr:endonuclease domain-containing protein [candidate division KSB1 bacterium]
MSAARVPIGHYIVDFVCHEKKIIIEVDGGQHFNQTESDRHRDQWLTNQGFRILRFWNTEVLLNFQGVLQKIYMEPCEPSS